MTEEQEKLVLEALLGLKRHSMEGDGIHERCSYCGATWEGYHGSMTLEHSKTCPIPPLEKLEKTMRHEQ
jgi:hypothetical protein